MKHTNRAIIAALLLCFGVLTINAQQLDRQKVEELLEKENCTTVSAGKIRICKFDFKHNGNNVEAVTFRPTEGGKFPSLLLIPGYSRTAKDLIPMGVMFAHNGFASVAITQIGFGKSEGKPDFVGPNTIKMLAEGWKLFKKEPYADTDRMGIYGHSRGGMAASLLALELKDAKAAVLSAGIYDFKKAYDESTIKGIRENMMAETGMTEQAIKERSSILRMDKLKTPVLILHGDKDENVQVGQAYILRDKLTVLKKEFEIKIFEGQAHGLNPREIAAAATDFFKRRMNIESASK